MEWFEYIESIKATLKNNDYNDLADFILGLQVSGGTPGEVLMAVCSGLLGIKKKRSDAYNHIKSEANALLNYGNSIGYSFTPTYPPLTK
jgi:hypothetical protein